MESSLAAPGAGQVAFLDHVLAVVDEETATAIAESAELRGFGRLEVGTVESDGETWTGRYLFGRRTYVEIFGPDDSEHGTPGAAGLGLSTRVRGGLVTLVERAARADAHLSTGRRTRERDGKTLPWFDYAEPDDDAQTNRAKPDHPRASFDIWVMEFLAEPDDHQLRAARYQEWYEQTGGITGQAPVLSEVVEVDVDVSAADAAQAAHVLEAAGFAITATPDCVSVRDGDTTIRLHITQGPEAGVRCIKFALVAPADQASEHELGRSTLIIGPGASAEWWLRDRPAGAHRPLPEL